MGVNEIERAVAERQMLAVCFAKVRRETLLLEVLPRQRDGRGEISTPLTIAPPRANRTRSVPAPQPTSSTVPAIAVEIDQPQEVVQLLEVILVEIGEEGAGPGPLVISRSWMCWFQ